MDKFQRDFCAWIMGKLERRPICRFFVEVNPADVNPAFQDPHRSMQAPRDLRGVRAKLEQGQYKSVNEWATDVHYIISHTRPKEDPERFYDAIAADLLRFFRKKWTRFPRSEREQWGARVEKTRRLALDVCKSMLVVCDDMLMFSRKRE